MTPTENWIRFTVSLLFSDWPFEPSPIIPVNTAIPPCDLARRGVNPAESGGCRIRYCDCAELIVHGLRAPAPPGHDCECVRVRTALVQEAERIANALAGDDPYVWMRRFVAAMDELSKPLLNGANQG